MKVLVIGSGGREHAIIWALSKSPLLKELYVAPGRQAMANLCTLVNIDTSNSVDVTQFCKKENIGLVVIGPEEPIINGLSDALCAEHIRVFAPSKAAAKLEAEKSFTKQLCKQIGIPTAKFGYFVDENLAKKFVTSNKMTFPLVVKTNGLASGKGVIICKTENEALSAIDLMLVKKKFGKSGEEIIIEEFLVGEEISFFVFVDGTKIKVLGCVKDYKRALENDEGPNTGGMGAYSAPLMVSKDIEKKIISEIIHPTVQSLVNMGTPYKGILFAGLIITKDGPKLLEYNVRFGDPETQVILPRLNCDLLELMLLDIDETLPVKLNNKFTVCVVVVSKGYPDNYKNGTIIKGLDKIQDRRDVLVFHAGTKQDSNGNWIADSGRVLNIVASGESLEKAKSKVYTALNFLEWPEGFFRYDIG